MGARKKPGELGRVSLDQRPSGLWRARARVRDGAGELVPLVAHADTAEAARDAVEAQAHQVWGGLLLTTSAVETIGQVAALWQGDLDNRVQLNEITPQTRQSYVETWEGAKTRSDRDRVKTLSERLGAVPLRSFTTPVVNRVLQSIELEATSAYARRAKRVLSLIAAYGVGAGVLVVNPVSGAKRIASSRPEFQIYTAQQIQVIFRLVRDWRGKSPERRGGARPNGQLLLDGMVGMLATSARPGEALAWRREDVIWREGRMAVRIMGTIVTVKGLGTYRQERPKHLRQSRGIFVPTFATATFRRLLASYEENPDGLLFATRNGSPYAVRYYEKLMRTFREQHEEELRAIGVDLNLFIPRSSRKTVGTTLAEEGGIELAQKALAHSDPRITSLHYVQPDDQVPAAGADILETKFAGIWGDGSQA